MASTSESGGPPIIIKTPTRFDILCGKGKECNTAEGSQRYRLVIDSFRRKYSSAVTRTAKMEVTMEIYRLLMKTNSRFLKFNDKEQGWEELPFLQARDKIGHALRFANRTNRRTPEYKGALEALGLANTSSAAADQKVAATAPATSIPHTTTKVPAIATNPPIATGSASLDTSASAGIRVPGDLSKEVLLSQPQSHTRISQKKTPHGGDKVSVQLYVALKAEEREVKRNSMSGKTSSAPQIHTAPLTNKSDGDVTMQGTSTFSSSMGTGTMNYGPTPSTLVKPTGELTRGAEAVAKETMAFLDSISKMGTVLFGNVGVQPGGNRGPSPPPLGFASMNPLQSLRIPSPNPFQCTYFDNATSIGAKATKPPPFAPKLPASHIVDQSVARARPHRSTLTADQFQDGGALGLSVPKKGSTMSSAGSWKSPGGPPDFGVLTGQEQKCSPNQKAKKSETGAGSLVSMPPTLGSPLKNPVVEPKSGHGGARLETPPPPMDALADDGDILVEYLMTRGTSLYAKDNRKDQSTSGKTSPTAATESQDVAKTSEAPHVSSTISASRSTSPGVTESQGNATAEALESICGNDTWVDYLMTLGPSAHVRGGKKKDQKASGSATLINFRKRAPSGCDGAARGASPIAEKQRRSPTDWSVIQEAARDIDEWSDRSSPPASP